MITSYSKINLLISLFCARLHHYIVVVVMSLSASVVDQNFVSLKMLLRVVNEYVDFEEYAVVINLNRFRFININNIIDEKV